MLYLLQIDERNVSELIKFIPVLKDYIWGITKMKKVF